MSRWRPVTKTDPCPACGKYDWCAWTPDGKTLRCMRSENPPAGMRLQKTDADGGSLFVSINGHATSRRKPVGKPQRTDRTLDYPAEVVRLRSKLTPDRLDSLAAATGVPATAWTKLAPGWADPGDLRHLRAGGAGWSEAYPNGAFVFAEHRGDGGLVGVSLRAVDGRKGSPAGSTGSQRGLVLPVDLHDLADPVLIVEGASDVAACRAIGLAAVGRPSNRAGSADLATLLDGRTVLVVGERDGKPDGSWPGRDGAKAVTQQLAGRWGEPVAWTLPPGHAKDLRGWLQAKIAGGLQLDDAEAAHQAGVELLAVLKEAAKTVKPQKRTQADALVDLALSQFRLGRTDRGDAFAVAKDGPAVAMMFRGGKDGLRKKLARMFRQTSGKTPSASALGDALVALEGQALDADPEPVALRIAEVASDMSDNDSRDSSGNTLVLDLADPTGRAVVIRPDGWGLVDRSPVLFQRTALSGNLPEPAAVHEPAAFRELRDLLNVTADAWPLVVGWLVAAYFPTIPHPVLMLGGEQGTGKSTAAKLMINLIDPSPALLRSQPRDTEQWAISAAGSWVVCIDNVSYIASWWSDALCKAVTGDGWIRRKLYTDSDLAVLTFKRCVALTSIDAGALRGDLGDRLLLIDLERITEDRRRTEAELEAAYHAASPRLLAGLLSAVSRTLAVLPDVTLDTMPRMADFARVLAALDRACPELTEARALDLFMGQRERIAGDVVDADPVAAAVVKLIEQHGDWSGTPQELLDALSPAMEAGTTRPPKGWPTSPQGIGSAMKRVTPALRTVGIEVERGRDSGRQRNRRWTIRQTTPKGVPHVRTPGDPPPEGDRGDSDRSCGPNDSPGTDPTGPAQYRLEVQKSPVSDDADMSDNPLPASSGRLRVRI